MSEINHAKAQIVIALLFASAMLLTSVLFKDQSQSVVMFLITLWIAPFFALSKRACNKPQAARPSSS